MQFLKGFLIFLFQLSGALIIAGIGGTITCGGNFLIPDLFMLKNGEYGPDYLFAFWISELIVCFIWGCYVIFERHNRVLRKRLFIYSTIILGIGLCLSVISYLFYI